MHQCMAPEWRTRMSHLLRSTASTNLAQDSLDEISWVGNKQAGLADFAHSRCD